MKKILLGLLAILMFFTGMLWVFSLPNLNKNDYYRIISYENDPEIQSDTISVMTYNIGYVSGMTNNLAIDTDLDFYSSNLNKAANVIAQLKPDLVGFQEIDFGASRSFYQNQLDTIALTGGYANAYKSVNWDKKYVPFPYWPIKNQFGRMLSGQAILSSFPLTSAETVVLDKPESNPFYYNAFYIDRLVQIADCMIGDQKVKLMNLHLEAFVQEARLLQASYVREIYDRYANEIPVILMGDFNSEPISESETVSEAIRVIMNPGNIASAISMDEYDANSVKFGTYSSNNPHKMIDYIFYNPEFIRKIDARVVSEMGEVSDHLPVWMSFEIIAKSDTVKR